MPIHVNEQVVAPFVEEICMQRGPLLLDECCCLHELHRTNSVLFAIFDPDDHQSSVAGLNTISWRLVYTDRLLTRLADIKLEEVISLFGVAQQLDL